MPTVRESVDRALLALAALGELGESIADEWQYVTDLEASWRDRLGEVATTRGDEPVADAVALAIERASTEAASISDPHRAIDWLSTLPQVTLLALGEAG